MITNTLNDLLSEKVLKLYSNTEYPLNLSILYNALSAKLKEDPGYEVWVPLVYCKNSALTRDKSSGMMLKPHKVFISNKGNICSLRGKEPKMLNHHASGDYTSVSLPAAKGRSVTTVVHRALACSFLSLDRFLLSNEGIESAHPKDLQVNHIDGIKTNYHLDNLEWSTSTDNLEHAVTNGLIPSGLDSSFTRPVKGTILSGFYTGQSFILHGTRECGLYGFKQPNISACIAGLRNSHRCCKWELASEEDIKTLPRGIDDAIKESFPTRVRILEAA